MFELTDDQQIVCDRFARARGDVVVHGLAGTGKTTLFTQGVVPMRDPLYLAPSNKACAILAAKLGPGANVQTVYAATHGAGAAWVRCDRCGLIRDDDQRVSCRKLKHRLQSGFTSGDVRPSQEFADATDVIVDESSMVGEDDRQTLESIRLPGQRFVYLGDPAQLPPVKRIGMFDAMARRRETPLHTMTEITRQAADSPIVRFAHRVRGGDLTGMASFPPRPGLTPDVVLTATHAARTKWNRALRRALFPGVPDDEPVVGDRLYVASAPGGAAFRKGDIVEVEDVLDMTETHAEVAWGFESAELQRNRLLDRDWVPTGKGWTRLDYAYALTVWASQGSEWDNVVVDVRDYRGNDRLKLLYTAVTRASRELVILT